MPFNYLNLTDLLGVDIEDKDFIFELYLPLLQEKIGHIQLSALEKAELTENTIGSVIKLLYAFLWQEHVIDFGGTYLMFKTAFLILLLFFRIEPYTRSQCCWGCLHTKA